MKYLRRLIWYLATRLIVLCCVLGLMTIAFYFSMNATNIYIILKDGMAKRAQVVMLGESQSTLDNYFTSAYLERDVVLQSVENGTSPYVDYSVTGFDHRLTMNWMWCWPWDDTARAQVTESIPAIDGKVKASSKANNTTLATSPPKWATGTYSVVLTRENGQWHIKNMTLVSIETD